MISPRLTLCEACSRDASSALLSEDPPAQGRNVAGGLHVPPALHRSARPAMPVLADKGYQGAGIGILSAHEESPAPPRTRRPATIRCPHCGPRQKGRAPWSSTSRPCSASPPTPPPSPRSWPPPSSSSPSGTNPDEKGSLSLSRRKDPGVGREWCDGAGGRVCGGCGSAVSGPGRRARVCGIGAAGWAVLHIRSGPAGGGSAESCGSAPAFNVVEVLPCAKGPVLHMGARPLKTGVLVRIPESRGKPRAGPCGRCSPMCSTPARAGKSPTRPAAAPPAKAPPGVRTPP